MDSSLVSAPMHRRLQHNSTNTIQHGSYPARDDAMTSLGAWYRIDTAHCANMTSSKSRPSHGQMQHEQEICSRDMTEGQASRQTQETNRHAHRDTSPPLPAKFSILFSTFHKKVTDVISYHFLRIDLMRVLYNFKASFLGTGSRICLSYHGNITIKNQRRIQEFSLWGVPFVPSPSP